MVPFGNSVWVRCKSALFRCLCAVIAASFWSNPCRKRIISDAGSVSNEITVKLTSATSHKTGVRHPNMVFNLQSCLFLVQFFKSNWNDKNNNNQKKSIRSVNAGISYVRHHLLNASASIPSALLRCGILKFPLFTVSFRIQFLFPNYLYKWF